MSPTERASGLPALPVPATAAAAVLLGGVAAFQVALAVGAPWGAAAWGGTRPGVLPARMRAASAASAGVYAGLAAVTTSDRVPDDVRRRVLAGASGAMVLGTVMNLASRSHLERAVWSPVAAALAGLLWVARRDGRRTAAR